MEAQTTDFTKVDFADLGRILDGAYHQLGIATGYKELSGELLKKSGNAYVNKRDEEAKLLRQLSDEFGSLADAKRRHYDAWLKAGAEKAKSELHRRDTDKLREKSGLLDFIEFVRFEINNQDGMPYRGLDIEGLAKDYLASLPGNR